MTGWGSGSWGSTPWGIGDTAVASPFKLTNLIAIAENRFLLEFTGVPYFTGLFDQYDGADPRRYTIAVVADTVGWNGEEVHPVSPVFVERDPDNQFALVLVVDRPMTPYPAKYVVSMTGIATGSPGSFILIDSVENTLECFAVHRVLNRPVIETGSKSRDFASPQTRVDMFDPLPDPNNPLNLGTFPVDDSGDYAFDEGTTSLKKRIIRRCISRKNSFAHMPSYGLGLIDYGKRLATSARLSTLVADAEQQISQEPEVAQVKAGIVPSTKPNLKYLRLLVKLKTGSVKRFDVPIQF